MARAHPAPSPVRSPVRRPEVVTDAVRAKEREAAMQQEMAASAEEPGAQAQGLRDLVKRCKV